MNAMLIQLVTAMLLVTTQLDHLYAHVMLDMLEWDNQETAQVSVNFQHLCLRLEG